MNRSHFFVVFLFALLVGCGGSVDPSQLTVPDKEYRSIDEIMALPEYSKWKLVQSADIQGPFRILGLETTRSASRPVEEFRGVISAEGHKANFEYNQSGKYHFVAAVLIENQQKELGIIMLGAN